MVSEMSAEWDKIRIYGSYLLKNCEKVSLLMIRKAVDFGLLVGGDLEIIPRS